jgi:hypothetical protein
MRKKHFKCKRIKPVKMTLAEKTLAGVIVVLSLIGAVILGTLFNEGRNG